MEPDQWPPRGQRVAPELTRKKSVRSGRHRVLERSRWVARHALAPVIGAAGLRRRIEARPVKQAKACCSGVLTIAEADKRSFRNGGCAAILWGTACSLALGVRWTRATMLT